MARTHFVLCSGMVTLQRRIIKRRPCSSRARAFRKLWPSCAARGGVYAGKHTGGHRHEHSPAGYMAKAAANQLKPQAQWQGMPGGGPSSWLPFLRLDWTRLTQTMGRATSTTGEWGQA